MNVTVKCPNDGGIVTVQCECKKHWECINCHAMLELIK